MGNMRAYFFLFMSMISITLWGQTMSGFASWYGQPFHGRRTASGETFDMNQFTGAHRTLPFGTQVKVTLLSTGRSVVVRINDRGPFVENRIIDLSRAAAQQIGLLALGVGRVELEVLGAPNLVQEEVPQVSPQVVTPSITTISPTVSTTVMNQSSQNPLSNTTQGGVSPVFVQMVALSNQQRAIGYARELMRHNFKPQIRQEANLFRVFLQVEEAELTKVEERLAQAGFRDWQMRRRPIPGVDVSID